MKLISAFFLTAFSLIPVSGGASQDADPSYSCQYTYSEPDGDEYTTEIDVFLNQGGNYIVYRDSQMSQPVQVKIDKIHSTTPDLVLEGTMTSPSWQPGADFVIRIGKRLQTMVFIVPGGTVSKHFMTCTQR